MNFINSIVGTDKKARTVFCVTVSKLQLKRFQLNLIKLMFIIFLKRGKKEREEKSLEVECEENVKMKISSEMRMWS